MLSDCFSKIVPFMRQRGKNILGLDRPHMRTACLIPQATNTLLHYVILIAFPLQQRLQ